MIRLGVVTLGGAVTLGTFIGQAPEFEATLASASVFSLGIVLNLGALSRFVDVYAGFRFQSELFSAPDLGQIVAKVSHERWTLARFLRALSAGYSDYSEYNAEKMVRSAKGRARGLHLLLVSVACYGTSISLILMGAL